MNISFNVEAKNVEELKQKLIDFLGETTIVTVEEPSMPEVAPEVKEEPVKAEPEPKVEKKPKTKKAKEEVKAEVKEEAAESVPQKASFVDLQTAFREAMVANRQEAIDLVKKYSGKDTGGRLQDFDTNSYDEILEAFKNVKTA